MKIESRAFGETASGDEIREYTLSHPSGVVAKVINFGAILTSLKISDRDGHSEEVTLGFDTLAEYEAEHPYFGATVGRYANRIGGARFSLDGKEYRLAENLPGTHLHGGRRGFDKAVWAATEVVDSQRAGIAFHYASPDGEENYPGALSVAVTYSIDDDGSLAIDYEAQTDRPTHVNLTNHTYWNLRGPGSGTVYDHEILIAGDHVLALDDDLVPTGELLKARGTPLDFTRSTRIGARIAELDVGYDHCYILDHGHILDRSGNEQTEPTFAARVVEPATGRVLEVWTTQPAVQLYTGNYLDGIRGAGGKTFQKHSAFCLETQHYPDSPNKPEFPSTLLRPGETYRQTTIHRFGAEKSSDV